MWCSQISEVDEDRTRVRQTEGILCLRAFALGFILLHLRSHSNQSSCSAQSIAAKIAPYFDPTQHHLHCVLKKMTS